MSGLFITLLNVTLNPYPGARPKKLKNNDKIINIRRLFETIEIQDLEPTSRNSLIRRIEIKSIAVCTPGGRGCTEKNGDRLKNRQVAIKNERGTRINPTINNPIYGFITITAKIHWKDNTIGNLSIPVDTSGVIGLRMGVSKQVKIRAGTTNPGVLIDGMIRDLEQMLFSYIGITRRRQYRIENMNCTFNLYTNLRKLKQSNEEPRPRIENYDEAMDMIYTEFREDYTINRPYAYAIVRTVHKTLFKAINQGPTFAISRLGNVEIQGLKTYQQAYNMYRRIGCSYCRHKNNIRLSFQPRNTPNNNFSPQLRRRGCREFTASPINQAFVSSVPIFATTAPARRPITRNNTGLKISMHPTRGYIRVGRKKCISYSKPQLVNFARSVNIPTNGTRKQICERIESKKNNSIIIQPTMYNPRNFIASIPRNNNQFRIGQNGVLFINNKPCSKYLKTQLIEMALQEQVSTIGKKSDLCYRLKSIAQRQR